MTILVTYANESMTISKQVCCDAALANGVDVVWPQNPDTITQEFKDFNPVLKEERGGGYWLWKPYHIYKAILQCKDGDTLIYSDAGVKLIANVNHIIDVMDQDIFLFSNGHQHVHWTKGDINKAILHTNEVSDHYQQVQASLIFFKVNDYTRRFVKEWLLFCQMPGLIDDSPSRMANAPGFAENRHDQAILSALAIREKLSLHWWPDKLWYESQRYRWANDKYPSMVEHHRKRNNEW